MQIEQALYGEARGGHSLLEASRNDAVSREIVQRLDLPDTAPPGAEWSPFLRGFPYRDRYLLSRTFLDTRASRGGMVFSHALIAPLDEIVRTSDLRPLLALLTSDARSRPPAISINLVDITTHPPEADDLLDMAEALASMIELPIVRAGQARIRRTCGGSVGTVTSWDATTFRFSVELWAKRSGRRSYASTSMYSSFDGRTLD